MEFHLKINIPQTFNISLQLSFEKLFDQVA